jgi:hypothetical protein
VRLLIPFFLCAWVVVAEPADAMRCARALVSEGDHKVDVYRKCGQPVSIEARVYYKSLRVSHPHHHVHQEISIPIEVEEWVYNFGPHRLMRWLRFENDRLIQIQTLQYGY